MGRNTSKEIISYARDKARDKQSLSAGCTEMAAASWGLAGLGGASPGGLLPWDATHPSIRQGCAVSARKGFSSPHADLRLPLTLGEKHYSFRESVC